MGNKREWLKIEDGIYDVGGVIYFRAMVGGKRSCCRAETQGAIARSGKRASQVLKVEYAKWIAGNMERELIQTKSDDKLKAPTFKELVAMYVKYADDERIKNGKPSEGYVRNAINAFRVLVEEGGFRWEDSVSRMSTDRIDAFLVDQIRRGKERVTAWSYASSWQSLTARWTASYYRREGFAVPVVAMPTFTGRRPKRYERPPQEALDGLKKWYACLWDRDDKRMWFCATMMLQFGMRNSDVVLLEEDWFRASEDGRGVELVYTPHKTSLTSRRRCRILVHAELWDKIKVAIVWMKEKRDGIADPAEIDQDVADGRPDEIAEPRVVAAGGLVPAAKWCFHTMNAQLRAAVPWFAKTTKGAYELRKICVDHIYQKYGAERASAISGDDIRTLSYYYAEPERAAPEAVMVTDMM